MKKYYIGVVVILLITFGFVGYTVYLGLESKSDVETQKSAEEISKKLNEYVKNNQKIPESLSEVGANDVPSTISYTKLSDSQYKFCVTYKSASGYYDSGISGVVTGVTANSYPDEYYESPYPSDYTEPDLYIDSYHKKGENCTTVKPYFSNSYSPPSYNYNLPDDAESPYAEDLKTNANNRAREADINTLHSQLEYYYGLYGYYPTLDNLNDSNWRTLNMKGLSDEALQDPEGSSKKLSSTAKTNTYVYSVKPVGCDNKTKDCTSYKLTATLDGGKEYSKNSLN